MLSDSFYRDQYTKFKESHGQYESAKHFNEKLDEIEQKRAELEGTELASAKKPKQQKKPYQNELAKILDEYCHPPRRKRAL